MSELERLLSDVAGQDFDVLLTYKAGTDPAVIAGKVRELVQQGISVRAQQAGDSAVTFKKHIELENGDTAI